MGVDDISVLHVVLRESVMDQQEGRRKTRGGQTSAGVSSARRRWPEYVNLNVPRQIEQREHR